MESWHLELGNMLTTNVINILMLGSYDVLINMECIVAHKTKVDCYKKSSETLNDERWGKYVARDKKSYLYLENFIVGSE